MPTPPLPPPAPDLDPDLWEYTPDETDVPGKRWTYTGRAGTQLDGATMTITVTVED